MIKPLLFLGMAMGVLTGCQSPSWPGAHSEQITELHLLGTPVAVNIDNIPGPDAVGVRVYASNATTANAIRIAAGSLDIHLYDGRVAPEDAITAAPLVRFSYSAAQLRTLEHKTAVGISYNFLAAWGEHKPTKDRVTIVATYKGPGQSIVRSPPITVPMGRQ